MTIYVLTHKREKTYQALVLGLVAVYALITCAIPFLHKDDCPATHGDPKIPLQSDSPCPACMFLATSHSAPVHCDFLPPALTQSKLRPEFSENSQVVVTSTRTGPILLRGPPAFVLS